MKRVENYFPHRLLIGRSVIYFHSLNAPSPKPYRAQSCVNVIWKKKMNGSMPSAPPCCWTRLFPNLQHPWVLLSALYSQQIRFSTHPLSHKSEVHVAHQIESFLSKLPSQPHFTLLRRRKWRMTAWRKSFSPWSSCSKVPRLDFSSVPGSEALQSLEGNGNHLELPQLQVPG